jgi:hypothetical protein
MGHILFSTYKANWARTDQFVWVMGTQDTMVWPREGGDAAALNRRLLPTLASLMIR